MASAEYERTVEHPYFGTSDAHKQFAPTTLATPAYSAQCIPFRWMLMENSEALASEHGLDFRPELEERARKLMGFDAPWVQDRHNQLQMLDAFFSAVVPERSLALFYAKRTPLADDGGRVLIGIGTVAAVSTPLEYAYSGKSELRSVLWERAVRHSIRPKMADGFLLPYHEILALTEQDPALDPADYLAVAPDDAWLDFSYASEHVSHDAAISALLRSAAAIRKCAPLVSGPWSAVEEWIDQQLNGLWCMRGPFPGLGSALRAFGLAKGNLVAHELSSALDDNADPWPAVDEAFANPASLSTGSAIDATTAAKWKALPDERRALLKLLARFDLSAEQATRYYQPSERAKARIEITDTGLLENPYLLYELDRGAQDPVAISTVDHGSLPEQVVRESHPMPAPSALDGPVDPRRVRALVTWTLEQAAADGDTVRPQQTVIQTIRDAALAPPAPIDDDLMSMIGPTMAGVVTKTEMADELPAYQLARLAEMGQVIRKQVELRQKGARHNAQAEWLTELETTLGPANPADLAELRAREEKAAALAELASSRVSVLIGPAGTGKTTLLTILCRQPSIAAGGIRLLAPTGKARVMLEKGMHQALGQRAQTIAQFLLRFDRYDPATSQYRLSAGAKSQDARTVIIDEASMLTEEALAATLDALTGVDRLILVGDPRQLPPIGAGRPFVDVVSHLKPANSETTFPRIGPGYAELTVRRRAITTAEAPTETQDDLLLADWFSGQAADAAADAVWASLPSAQSTRLRARQWKTPNELQNLLIETLAEELNLGGEDDETGFEESLGGSPYGEAVYFHPGRDGQPGAAAKVESWQILSPVRGQAHGVVDLNRFVQRTFRTRALEWATHPEYRRRVPKPAGPENIVYGDKVIAVRNKTRKKVYPDQSAQHYVANGEIGVAVGEYRGRTSKMTWSPRNLEVEFSSQQGEKYTFFRSELGGDDGEPMLELAYAVTVHKAQGSEFGTTVLVLPDPCRLLSRELLYTAFTRQRSRLVILHQGDLSSLKRYASEAELETAKRLTNLFHAPSPVAVEGKFLEEGLIHRTKAGELVRSKSEVIIADLLKAADLEYGYERPLRGLDGVTKYPDFTIEQPETGKKVFWEHLGLLMDDDYRRRWNDKLVWYREQGIMPEAEGGGPAGTLITSQDDERGGIDARAIDQLIRHMFA